MEKAVLSAIVLGPYELTPWKPRDKEYDFYDLKGTLETLAEHLHLQLNISPNGKPFLMAGKSVRVHVDDIELGYLAQVAPKQNLVSEAGQNAYAIELDLEALEKLLPPSKRFRAIAKFPETYRDISILVDRSITSQKVEDLILKTGFPLIQKIALYDHFEGKKIQANKKSLTFALSFQSENKTLSDKEVAPLFEKIVQTLNSELGASLRE